VRISELAERVGVPTSTVRYYERGLLEAPERTSSGYRDYDEVSATQLLFVARARHMGLSCEQISELLPVWGGSNCSGAHAQVRQLVLDKQAEIAEQVAALHEFSGQLDEVLSALESSPPLHVCRTDLGCCVPDGPAGPVVMEIAVRH
jgi:DNA-binding transcriptional MerR regulator